jgi:hypothetical protein
MVPLERPTWWGQALFSVWLGNAVWTPRLHTIVRGTPDSGYRKYECLRDFLITNGFKVGKVDPTLLKLLQKICLYAKFMLMISYLGLLTNLLVKSLVGS